MNESLTQQTSEAPAMPTPLPQEVPQTGNAYPLLRRLFLVLIVIAVLLALLFLLYLNGRSLYTYGL